MKLVRNREQSKIRYVKFKFLCHAIFSICHLGLLHILLYRRTILKIIYNFLLHSVDTFQCSGEGVKVDVQIFAHSFSFFAMISTYLKLKVKFPLWIPWRRIGGVEIKFYQFLTTVLVRSVWSTLNQGSSVTIEYEAVWVTKSTWIIENPRPLPAFEPRNP